MRAEIMPMLSIFETPTIISPRTSTISVLNFFKYWDSRSVYKFLCEVHQCLLHSFIPSQDHDFLEPKVEGEHRPIFFCKLEQRPGFMVRAGESTSRKHWFSLNSSRPCQCIWNTIQNMADAHSWFRNNARPWDMTAKALRLKNSAMMGSWRAAVKMASQQRLLDGFS